MTVRRKANKKGAASDTLKKHKKVIDAWFQNGFNGVEAYLSVFKTAKRNTAKIGFYKIRHSEEIEKYINRKQINVARRAEATEEKILIRLLQMLKFDSTVFLGMDADDIKELPRSIREMLQVEASEKGDKKSFKVKAPPKMVVLDMICKHIGFYEQKKEREEEDGFNYDSMDDETLMKLIEGVK